MRELSVWTQNQKCTPGICMCAAVESFCLAHIYAASIWGCSLVNVLVLLLVSVTYIYSCLAWVLYRNVYEETALSHVLPMLYNESCMCYVYHTICTHYTAFQGGI